MENPRAHLSASEEVEIGLKKIWADALRMSESQVQTDLPFIALGGDSLSAMLCISRIRSRYAVVFELMDFYDEDNCSSIREIAKRIVDFSRKAET